MVVISLIIGLIYIGLMIALLKSKKGVKKVILGILVCLLLIPASLLVLVKPAQKGVVFPGWGKLSLLMFEPADLWEPLSERSLIYNEYAFQVFHKYVGNYNISILFDDKDIDAWKVETNDLSMSIYFYLSNQEIFTKSSEFIGAFKGRNGSGLSYIRYSLPDDLPLGQTLQARLVISGDIKEFINKYGSAKIIIKKGSDL